MIRKAFEQLMNRFKGEILFDGLVQAFDEKNHPDVNIYQESSLTNRLFVV